MALNPIVRPLGLLFSFVGLIQGVAWFIAAVLSILLNCGVLDVYLNDSYAASLLLTFESIYFTNNTEFIVGKDVFLGVSIAYLVLSAIWMVVSGFVFYCKGYGFEKWKNIRSVLIIDIALTIVISILDILLMSLLIHDYNDNENVSLVPNFNGTNCTLLVIGIMITIAARGFVLWLLNACFAIYAICVIVRYDNEIDPIILHNIPIDAYREYPGDPNYVEAVNSDNIRSSWYMSRSYSNEAYMQDSLTPSDSHQSVPHFPPTIESSEGTPSLGQAIHEPPSWQLDPPASRNNFSNVNWQQNDQVPKTPGMSQYAKPIKPLKIPPPVPPPKPNKKGPPIPFPDYTPPQSPKHLRSVIKRNSSYY